MAGIAGQLRHRRPGVIASGVGLAPHMTVGEGAIHHGLAGVGTNVPAGAVFAGTPATSTTVSSPA